MPFRTIFQFAVRLQRKKKNLSITFYKNGRQNKLTAFWLILAVSHQLFCAPTQLFFGVDIHAALLDGLLHVSGQSFEITVRFESISKVICHNYHLVIIIYRLSTKYSKKYFSCLCCRQLALFTFICRPDIIIHSKVFSEAF